MQGMESHMSSSCLGVQAASLPVANPLPQLRACAMVRCRHLKQCRVTPASMRTHLAAGGPIGAQHLGALAGHGCAQLPARVHRRACPQPCSQPRTCGLVPGEHSPAELACALGIVLFQEELRSASQQQAIILGPAHWHQVAFPKHASAMLCQLARLMARRHALWQRAAHLQPAC